ncbi:Hemolysin-type calcium-binding repeat-containing protein [Paracoccus aminovorans]|uniref:Hemolysin-type calcium-binding repeat-containing protein n=1 Tax=Paracoccus aminovorans TaxID=34004 RepID=A0A1I2XU08_9RHOB|nr:calcium-binding protein [Paracoccus aminovorans]CQR87229.1 hypothetical protein JCM7685_2685 [Paracoccus aminovorans]SFH16988.1 Hemolysin-type calcium-binding repeat-containing protein [Paracoccus aminovorans]
MNQTIFLMLGLLGLVGIGSLVSSNDDDHAPDDAGDPYGGRDLIEGTNDADTITGTAGDDAIQSYDGDDSVDAGAGDDLVWTGYGNDTVSADAGDDEIYLGYGDDVYGAENSGVNEGDDTIDGGEGNDSITTNLGHHSITGGRGDDTIFDNGGTVYIDGEEGDDLILSPDDSDPDAPDTLLGGDGNDTIHAGGYDIVDGGDGDDTYMLSSAAGGAADITYSSDDTIVITLAEDYAGEGDYTLEQDGDDVQLLLDGKAVAVLRDTLVDAVGAIDVVSASAT